VGQGVVLAKALKIILFFYNLTLRQPALQIITNFFFSFPRFGLLKPAHAIANFVG
jgi:hypothetical protein